jgi:hypothetical protein
MLALSSIHDPASSPPLFDVAIAEVVGSYAAMNSMLFTWERDGHRAVGHPHAWRPDAQLLRPRPTVVGLPCCVDDRSQHPDHEHGTRGDRARRPPRDATCRPPASSSHR